MRNQSLADRRREAVMKMHRADRQDNGRGSVDAGEPFELDMMPETQFRRMLALERKRTERSKRPFVLMLLDCSSLLKSGEKRGALEHALFTLFCSIRETDVRGWYKDRSILGVIFTEIGTADGSGIVSALLRRIGETLSAALRIEDIREIRVSFHVFPDDWETGSPSDPALYPDLEQDGDWKSLSRVIKRIIDIAGSITGLLVLSPLMLAIAAAVAITSPGPVLFRQHRLGRYREHFTCLKFRSMRVDNDSSLHEAYITSLISERAASSNGTNGQPTVFKLTQDPRVTPIGKFLRRTSLDELPQLLNVLFGQMSLVGPRPPIPYEYERYDLWHRRRLLGVKPGITGLWQVSGRSRVSFPEMVRMDLQYCQRWSLLLDLQILLRTPRVVFSRDGAY
jgi:lipopolysaccharide/colanic/teichoic acid biosynthesis glycosyltransferase